MDNIINTLEVCVLMATYNGEKYLREQVDSIIGQHNININLVVRDDGSTDSTINILSEYEEKGLLTYTKGANLGPARSFMELLKFSPISDYYAFSDQDDIWLPDKIKTAVDMMKEDEEKPALYFCQTQLVDENLKKMENVVINPKLTFGESLIYHFIGGCTMVMNRKMRDYINLYKPEFLIMHDVWIYKVAQAINANIYFDSTPHILYRQHCGNTVGQKKENILFQWKNRLIRTFKEKDKSRSRYAQEILKGYLDYLTPNNKNILELFIQGKKNIKKRMLLIADRRFKTSDRNTNLSFTLSLLFNTY